MSKQNACSKEEEARKQICDKTVFNMILLLLLLIIIIIIILIILIIIIIVM